MSLFYEDDEPIEEIEAAFERSPKGTTHGPARGQNFFFSLPGTSTRSIGCYIPGPATFAAPSVVTLNPSKD